MFASTWTRDGMQNNLFLEKYLERICPSTALAFHYNTRVGSPGSREGFRKMLGRSEIEAAYKACLQHKPRRSLKDKAVLKMNS